MIMGLRILIVDDEAAIRGNVLEAMNVLATEKVEPYSRMFY
jgi:hypothetical protein